MGSELDLNDVAFGHRLALEELAQLRRAERERDELLAALKSHIDAVSMMHLAMEDGVNVHGAISGLIGATDMAIAVIAKVQS